MTLRSRRMAGMSLGTCPRLGAISIDCESMLQVGVLVCCNGCNACAQAGWEQARAARGVAAARPAPPSAGLLAGSRCPTGLPPCLPAMSIPACLPLQLDLRGCNQLESLQLGCPKLRTIDATFCSKLRCGG